MGKHKPMNDYQYADMYGLNMKDRYDDEGNLNDNEHDNRAMIAGHQANNYDMRRTHEMLQDDGFRRHMKAEGFKGVDRMVKDNMPSTKMLSALQSWGGDIGTHNNKGKFDTRDLGATFKSFANEHRDYTNQRMDDKYASQRSLDEMKDKLLNKDKSADTADVTETSPDLSQAQEEVNNYETNYLTNAGDQISGVANSDDVAQAAFDNEVSVNEANPDADNPAGSNAYKNDYSFDVKKGLKLSGVPTRGPGSIA